MGLCAQAELDCLLGEPLSGCGRRPDILVVNSGLHDAQTSAQHFIENIETIGEKLRGIADNGTRVRPIHASSLVHFERLLSILYIILYIYY